MASSRIQFSKLSRPAGPLHSPLPVLRANLRCDVCVVGGGLTGMLTALLAAQAGRSVVLLEARRLGSGESALSTGHVTEVLDTRFTRLIKLHGRERIEAFSEAHRAAIHQLMHWEAGWIRVPGYLYTEQDHQLGVLRRELEAMAELHISSNSQRYTPLPFPVLEAIRVENQAVVDPGALASTLRQAAQAAGVQIFEDSPAVEIDAPRPPHRRQVRVSTEAGSVASEWCVLATHSPIFDLHPVHFELKARRTYVLGARLRSSTLLAGTYWDLGDPYHFIRPSLPTSSNGIWVGGMDHDVGSPPRLETDLLARLEDFARARFEVEALEQAWSGQILETADGLPYLGHSLQSGRILFATGFGGNGVSMAMLAANLLHSRIEESRSDLADFLSPLRLRNPRTWIALASNSMGFLEKKTTPALRRGRPCDPEKLAEGEACVGDRDGASVAQRVVMSRDESGEVREFSAYCPHMGVELRYNELEKTWDCPGHGSRFDLEGRVICGPAHCSLQALEKDVAA